MEELVCDSEENGKKPDLTKQRRTTKCIKVRDEKTFWILDDSQSTEAEIEITLIGHSMGTIVLDALIAAFPNVPFKRIVYMASASSVEDVKFSPLPYLEYHQHSEFFAFTLSRGDDARETQPHCIKIICWPSSLDPIERGSLLVWIDNYLEPVNAPNQLRFGRYKNIRVQNFRPSSAAESRVRIKRFEELEDEPRRHSDFTSLQILEKILCSVDNKSFPGGCSGYKGFSLLTDQEQESKPVN
jgi:hypothetical protein